MSSINLGRALEWWLRNQGKFDGAQVCTGEGQIEIAPYPHQVIRGDGNFQITKWVVNGVPQPTESECDSIIADYEASI